MDDSRTDELWVNTEWKYPLYRFDRSSSEVAAMDSNDTELGMAPLFLMWLKYLSSLLR